MALIEVRALLETLEFGVTPCTVIAPGLRESVQMLLEKGAPGEAPRLLALLLGSSLVDTTSVKRDVPPETKAAMAEARVVLARVGRDGRHHPGRRPRAGVCLSIRLQQPGLLPRRRLCLLSGLDRP